MRNCIIFALLITASTAIFANDGGIEYVGGSLVPINITTVSMDYERIFITLKRDHFDVEVYIELNNHESAAIDPLLGFEFGLGGLLGGMQGSFNIREKIKEFALLVNDDPQRFELGTRGEERDQYLTLIYRPRLNPGINTVYHKFQMPYGFGSAAGVVTYILTTGSRWKGGVIGNLEIFIRSEFNALLSFEGMHRRRGSYVEPPVWSVVEPFNTIGQSKFFRAGIETNPNGIGSLDVYTFNYYSITPNGYLYANLQNFIPDRNILFQVINWTGQQYITITRDDPPYTWPRDNPFIMIYEWKNYIEHNNSRSYRFWEDDLPLEKMLEGLTVEQLRILRNTIYAINGYVFRDSFLNEYFNRQYWYFPNPNIALNDISLSNVEQQILQHIVTEENRR